MDIQSILLWERFNCYNFIESTHQYFYNEIPVKYSVTQFLSRFSEPFDSESVSKRYAEKHGLNQSDVLAEWKRKGDISATAGTIVHSFLENAKRGKTFDIDYSIADKLGIREEVEDRVNILLPQAIDFHKDTLNRLFPIKLEYTVGIEDVIAGNIDMLCWNEKAQEIQIWDYKNLKSLDTERGLYTKNCFYPFENYIDTNYIHYSMQLCTYKQILQRVLGIQIGQCYLVVFNYANPEIGFQVVNCLDMTSECEIALKELVQEVHG